MPIVRYTTQEILEMNKDEEEFIKKLSSIKDKDINFDDIPELTEEQLKNPMSRDEFFKYLYEKRKAQKDREKTILDDEANEWLKNQSIQVKQIITDLVKQMMVLSKIP